MIGEGINRIDGPLKVTGRAVYSYERQDAGQPLYGAILGSAIGKGRVTGIDTSAAEAAPGVRLVWTHRNAPEQQPFDNRPDMFGRPHPELTGDIIEYYGQAVAFVVADSFEQARAAAGMIEIAYQAEQGAYDLASAQGENWPDPLTIGPKGESRFGDVDGAMTQGPVTVEATYSTPYHFSHPIELPACLADWRDGHLHVYAAAQMVTQFRSGLANTLKMNPKQITVDAAFVGGGFGSKIFLHAETVLGCLATRALGKPVKAMLTRRQIFTLVGHRPAVISHIRLAATPDGQLTAIGHDANMQSFGPEPWSEPVATVARSLYAAPNRLTRHAKTALDIRAGEAVRAPGELPGLLVFESALDELAEKLGMDPVELRIKNDTDIDPELNLPLSGRRLADCLRDGAQRFGWDQRPMTPASRRDGRWLIGYGVASSMRAHFQGPTEVKVRIEPQGRVLVQTDMTDIGTGTYTIAAQVAAAGLGVPVAQVKVELARTDYPVTQGSGGSWGAPNTSIAIDRACQRLKEQIAAVAEPGYNDLFAEIRRHFPQGLEATGKTLSPADDPHFSAFSQYTYGASFAEVAVDADTAEVRVRRMLGVFSAGRIINPKTARSQLIGGMIWGVSAALHEGAHVDPRYGNWVNGDLADYVIPVHADIPDIEAIMLDDPDLDANHLGIKGIGELGACGTGGSVANAVYNATGVRVRDFPITLARLLPGLPTMA
jgi:xanthine dehydrogenase YagR molybdenum-binding subunit